MKWDMKLNARSIKQLLAVQRDFWKTRRYCGRRRLHVSWWISQTMHMNNTWTDYKIRLIEQKVRYSMNDCWFSSRFDRVNLKGLIEYWVSCLAGFRPISIGRVVLHNWAIAWFICCVLTSVKSILSLWWVNIVYKEHLSNLITLCCFIQSSSIEITRSIFFVFMNGFDLTFFLNTYLDQCITSCSE